MYINTILTGAKGLSTDRNDISISMWIHPLLNTHTHSVFSWFLNDWLVVWIPLKDIMQSVWITIIVMININYKETQGSKPPTRSCT